MNSQWDGHSRAGVTGGMVLTMLATISGADIIRTAVLAATGTTISLIVSLLLKKILKR